MSSDGGTDERTRLLFFPLSAKWLGGPAKIWVEEIEGGISGFAVELDPKWVSSLDTLLEASFFPKSSMHDPYWGLGTVMGMLLDSIVSAHMHVHGCMILWVGSSFLEAGTPQCSPAASRT